MAGARASAKLAPATTLDTSALPRPKKGKGGGRIRTGPSLRRKGATVSEASPNTASAVKVRKRLEILNYKDPLRNLLNSEFLLRVKVRTTISASMADLS